MKEITTLKNVIIAAGTITRADVEKLRQLLLSDGKISEAGADLLFELKYACRGADNHSSWIPFFAGAICTFLLDDEGHDETGEDNYHSNWLVKKIRRKDSLDLAERAIFVKLAEEASGMAEEIERLMREDLEG